MRKTILILLSFAFIFSLALKVSGEESRQESQIGTVLVIDNFADYQAGKFPSKWRTWPFQRGKAQEVYQIAEENGRKYLKAKDDKDLSQQTMRYFNWDLERYPYLSWKWRARELPKGAAENDDNKNDSACGVYVIIGTYTGDAIKYVWSTSLPVAQTVTRRDGKLKIKVADSGALNLNKWVSHTVNVPADYKELFGGELKKKPSGIAVLTDGNATHTAAACDYADFTISKEQKQ